MNSRNETLVSWVDLIQKWANELTIYLHVSKLKTALREPTMPLGLWWCHFNFYTFLAEENGVKDAWWMPETLPVICLNEQKAKESNFN